MFHDDEYVNIETSEKTNFVENLLRWSLSSQT